MVISRRHLTLASRWLPSACLYGASAGLAFLYVIDWEVVVKHVPYYGSKFQN